jgi:hypothetical protein
LDLGRKIQKNETTHPAVLIPISTNQTTLRPGLLLLSCTAGFEVTRIIKPMAMQLAITNFKGFFRMAGAFRRGPRKRPINATAASHSTGVLKNHS